MGTTMQYRTSRVRTAGALCLAGAAVGVLGGLVTGFLPPAVSPEMYRYPYTPGWFVAAQLSFILNHVLLLAGITGVALSGAVGASRPGRVGLWVAGGGMALLTLCEVAGIGAVRDTYPSPLTEQLDTGYGVASLLIGAGLVVAGIAVVRQRHWTGWARLTVLACGLALFVVVLPGLFGPFLVGRLAITAWMVLFGALGLALMSAPGRKGDAV